MTSTVEQRDFRIANNMIFHLVFSQAGTVAKALTELVMNSQDAGADTFKLTIDNNGFCAADNGRGFCSREEIENWFEELGFEHTSELHQQDGRFSRFGLGRAQIMAFAPTRWLTNTFCMDVDIKARGMGYDLYLNQEQVKGCSVEGQWYEPMSFSDLKTALQEFEELIAYARITVEVNGNVVNNKNIKWDYETDQVFIKRRETGNLSVYNQGVLVRTYPGYSYGAGIVVSKVPFTLNIARNDILQSSCAVWKEVRAFLRQEAAERTKNKIRLNDAERQLLLNQFIDGEVGYDDVKNSPLIEDVTGRKWKLDKLMHIPVTVHTQGMKLLADRIQQTKTAFVLSGRMMEVLNVDTPAKAVSTLEKAINQGRQARSNYYREINLKFIPIEDLLGSNNELYTLLTDKELSKVEKVALTALGLGMGHLQDAVYQATNTSPRDRSRRKLHIGQSEGANAWTDGCSFVAIQRDFLRQHIRDGFRGFTTLANVLVHELCHECNTATGHDHGAEFYEMFHDVLCGRQSLSYGTALRRMTADFLGRAQKAGLKLSRNELRDLDREVDTERSVYEDDSFLKAVNEAAA